MSKGIPVDYTIDKLFKEIQENAKAELGIDIELDTIKRIVDGQSLSTVEGMKNGHTICWKYYGSFVATDKRVKALNDLYARKGLTPTLVDTGFQRLVFHKNGLPKG